MKKFIFSRIMLFGTAAALALSTSTFALDKAMIASADDSAGSIVEDVLDTMNDAVNNMTAAQITQQIKDTYAAALKNSGKSSFNGFCGSYVNQQLIALGIANSTELGGNGNVWYSKMSKLKKTSKGYNIKMYPGTNCVADIWNAHNKNNVFNIVVAFSKGGGSAGAEYGHVLFIHGIIDGKVYFSENSKWGSTPEGGVLTCDVSKFASRYTNEDCVFDGAGHFTTSEVTPAPTYSYELISGTHYMKNKSTGTYLYLPGSDTNKSAMSLGAKKDANAYKMVFSAVTSGNANNGHYITPKGCTRVVNPYADAPTNGTKVTLYDKETDGTQYWCAEKVGTNEYIFHVKWDQNLVLTGSGTNVTVATNAKSANQIWTLENADVTLSSIKIDEGSFTSVYEDGASFNPAGLTLTATYSDGSTKTISEGYTLSAVTLGGVGETTLTATYGGKTATTAITVQDLFEGNGTAESPYLINTADDLKNFADAVNDIKSNVGYISASYKQTADIDLSDYPNWTPIGCFYANGNYNKINPRVVFYGNYDGDKHSIINLNIDSKYRYSGLFGRIVESACIENLSLSGTIVSADNYAGGFVAELANGATIRNCSFTGSVYAPSKVGGIAGKIYRGATINNCYVNAEITATGEKGLAGGILSRAQINNTEDSTDINIRNCYFVGKVSGVVNGGIYAEPYIDADATKKLNVSNCYYLNSASTGAAFAGCTGLISSQLKTIATDLGSPFADNADATLNGGYPVFEWQVEEAADVVAGDVNGDTTIDLKDVVLIRRHIAGGWDVEVDLDAADVNDDGNVDLKDVVLIRRYIAGGWDVELK